jgi:AcrR family transcriptional regulator
MFAPGQDASADPGISPRATGGIVATTLQDVQRAAVRLFAERGFAATGIRDIGREVGINSATLYHHAGTKEILLVGIMKDALQELLRVGREAVEASSDPPVQLARLVMAQVSMETTNRQTAFVVDNEVRYLTGSARSEIMALRDDYESLVERVLERGARLGVFDVPDRRATRLGLLGMLNEIKTWYHPEPGEPVERIQDWFVDLALRLVRATPVQRDECGPLVVVPRLLCEPEEEAAHAVSA